MYDGDVERLAFETNGFQEGIEMRRGDLLSSKHVTEKP